MTAHRSLYSSRLFSLLIISALLAVDKADAQNRDFSAERLILDDAAGDGGFNSLTLQVPVTGLTANRTLTLPDADGTLLALNGTPAADQIFFGGPSGQLSQSAAFLWNDGASLFSIGPGLFTVDGTSGLTTISQSNPTDALVINHSGADGFSIFIDQTNPLNTEDIVRVDVAGDGDAININVDGGGNGLDIDMNATATDDGISVQHDGVGDGIDVDMGAGSTDEGISITQDGPGLGLISRGFGGGEAAVFVEGAGGRGVTIDETSGGEGMVIFETGGGDGLGVSEEDAGWGMGILESGNGDGLHIVEEDNGDALHVESFDDGRGLVVQQNGATSAAAVISIQNPASAEDVLAITTDGTGRGLDINQAGLSGQGLRVRLSNGGNTDDALRVSGNTGSNALRVNNGNVDFDEDLNVDGTTTTGDLAVNTTPVVNSRLTVNQGHWTSQGTAPTALGDGTNIAAGITLSGTATDVAGMITATDGGSIGLGTITVTFALPYQSDPVIVVTPTNASAAGTTFFVDNVSGTSFDLNIVTTVGDGTALYSYYYRVIETD